MIASSIAKLRSSGCCEWCCGPGPVGSVRLRGRCARCEHSVGGVGVAPEASKQFLCVVYRAPNTFCPPGGIGFGVDPVDTVFACGLATVASERAS